MPMSIEEEGQNAQNFLKFCSDLKKHGKVSGQYNGPDIFTGNMIDQADMARMLIGVRPDLKDQIKANCGVPIDAVPTRDSLGGQRRSIGQSMSAVRGLGNFNRLLDSFSSGNSTSKDNNAAKKELPSQVGSSDEIIEAEWEWANDNDGSQIARYLGSGE